MLFAAVYQIILIIIINQILIAEEGFAMRFAAVEGGGTSWSVALAEDVPDNIILSANFPTTSPEETLGKIRDWLLSHGPFDSLGIASFGPIDGKIGSPTYGYITSTPKPGWKNTNVVELLGMNSCFAGIPYLFDTDVNAPALAEFLCLEDKTLSSCAYITVGTGVGVGLVINGKTVHGLVHPEAGHFLVSKLPHDEFKGSCPFHGGCVEGMISTGALSSRLGISIHELPTLSDDHVVWDYFSHYLAQLCASLILISSPEIIVIGGGVLNRLSLFDKIRSETIGLLNGYIQSPSLESTRISNYIRPSRW